MGNNKPLYSEFGKKLRTLRERANETLLDLSGAVELDDFELKKIEEGHVRPSEDIVLLLINHFTLDEAEAFKMWELAGYATIEADMSDQDTPQPTTVFIPPNDARIVYTDMVHVNANKYGVVINFLQGLGSNNQPMAISRVGMSTEHAKSLIKVLQDTIALSEKNSQPKQIDPGK